MASTSLAPLRIVGLMSGTSGDGVDAALVTVEGAAASTRFRLERFLSLPYPRDVRESLFDVARNYTGATDIALWHFRLGELFAAAAQMVLEGDKADVVACHGHTVAHVSRGGHQSTLQLGCPAVIAERVGATVVTDFRARDMAAGGQGAPLVSYVDWFLLRHDTLSRAIINIGGIANLTNVPPRSSGDDPVAFDTGPGNAMIDRAAYRLTAEAMYFDESGAMASRGKPDEDVLRELMSHPYLQAKPPKSTGRDEFGEVQADDVVDRMSASGKGREDIMATITAFAARCIARGLEWVPPIDEVIISGGGVHNRALMGELTRLVTPTDIRTSQDVGLPVDAKEAIAFAILGNQTIRGLPGNVPAATGARHPVVLGSITPGSNYTQLMRRLFSASPDVADVSSRHS